MKKIVMAVVALVVILSASVVNVNAQMRHLSPEQIAEIRSERMARELHLSAAQYAKLYRLNLREARRMNHGGACFFDCEDYRCDLRQIIGIINYRLYESLVHNHRHNHHRGHLHAQVHHSHSVHVAPHVAPHAKPHVEAHKAHVKPHAEPHAKPHAKPAPQAKPAPGKGGAGKPEAGKPGGGNGGHQNRPQYRMK